MEKKFEITNEITKQDEIEITPEMVEAGVMEAREHPIGADLSDLVSKVYLAMALEAPVNASASATSSRR